MNIIQYRKPETFPWLPGERLAGLQEEMNRLFESSFGEASANLFGGWTPALDVHDDNNQLTVTVELPGMKKEEINISLHEGSLTISGERRNGHAVKEGESFRSERSFGRFQRTVHIPGAVEVDQVSASYRDGLLTVVIPKTEASKPKQINITAA